MTPHVRRGGLLAVASVLFAVALAVVGANAGPCGRIDAEVAIPAYFYPMGDNVAQWQQLRTGAPQVGLAIATGLYSGTSADTNYLREITATRAAGITVLGYVNTSAGARDVAAVETEIDEALSWYHVDGIFFDQSVAYAADCSQATWYADLDAYVKAAHPGAITVMNHGSTLPECFATAADVLLTAEHDWAWYRDNYRPRGWEQNYPASKFWHVVHSVPAEDTQTAIDLMEARHAGWITVTDRTTDAPEGVFGKLPSPTVWQAELDAATPPPSGPPVGLVDPLVRAPGGARLSGWAVDPDSKSAAKVSWAVDGGAWSSPVAASLARPDAAAAWASLGAGHGFSSVIKLAAGSHSVCVRVHDLADVATTSPVGCQSLTVSAAPVGLLESVVRAPGGVRVTGWSLDPDTASASKVAVTVDGLVAGTFSASSTRADVAAAWPGYGAGHGLSSVVKVVTAGAHTVCASALDSAGGPAARLGCLPVVVTTTPVGMFQSVAPVNGGVLVTGWALDPDTASAIKVSVTVDGLVAGTFSASSTRADLAAAWPGYGTGHGLSSVVKAKPGVHTVCAAALDSTASRPSTPLGCLPVTL